ncbi:MAG: hypothetical protein IPK85_11870 [Gemmatimonadetes bacterium]|nr:hypothetical protein [Gemmatimonadota bacterium]
MRPELSWRARVRAWLLLGAAPAVLLPGSVADASGAGPSAGLTAWLVVPLIALSSVVLVLAPGLLAALALRRTRSLEQWLVDGCLLSVVGVSVASGIAQALVGEALRGRTYSAFLLGLGAIAGAWAMRRQDEPDPAWAPAAGRWLTTLAVTWWVACLLLLPKLLWESFNGDGAHAWESSRRLLYHAMPFWPGDAGPVAGFPGLTSMLYAFPNAWFLRLFGEVEFAARVPLLLYLVVLWAGVRRVGAALMSPRRVSGAAEIGLALSLVAYLLAMSFSASYSPYSADMALPATQDTLLVIAFLGVVTAAVERDRPALFVCTFLTYVSLPSGLLLIGFWLAARVVVERPVPWREVVWGGGALLVAMVLAAGIGRVGVALGGAAPGGEYGIVGILRYFAFVQFTDLARLRYVAIPAGVLPVLLLARWRHMDELGRALVLVTVAYFGFFFVQAHVSLHHFVPAMVLPMVVAWRQVLPSSASTWVAPAWTAAAALAVGLAFPFGRTAIHRDGQEVGARVLVRIPGYATAQAAPMRAGTLLDRLFPYDWDATVPATYGGSPLVWSHYARHGGDPGPETNYIVQLAVMPMPDGFSLAGADSAGAVVLVRSDSVLAVDRARRPPTPAGSRWLDVPRGILFHGIPLAGGPRIIDVAASLTAAGLDPAPLLERLGVKRRGGA